MGNKIKTYRATLNYVYELNQEDLTEWAEDLSPETILNLMREDLMEMDSDSLWDHIETELIEEDGN